jgi:hypothetical protein
LHRKGYALFSQEHANNATSKRNITEGKVHLIVESIYLNNSVYLKKLEVMLVDPVHSLIGGSIAFHNSGRLHMSRGKNSVVYPKWVLNFRGASDWPQENMLLYMREAGRKYAWM